MVKYLAEGQDFGPEHFAKEFGFTNSAYDDRATTNRRGRQSDGVMDRPAATEDGTYVGRAHGGRMRRADGGSTGGEGYDDDDMVPSPQDRQRWLRDHPEDRKPSDVPAKSQDRQSGLFRPRARMTNANTADNDRNGADQGEAMPLSRGGRLHRAFGGGATLPPQSSPGQPTGVPEGPGGGGMLGGATITMPAANMAHAADRMVQLGHSMGQRDAMATMGARMPPGATRSLVANPPAHTQGIPGLKDGGRAPHGAAQPHGVLVIIAGKGKGAPAGRMHRADGGDVDYEDQGLGVPMSEDRHPSYGDTYSRDENGTMRKSAIQPAYRKAREAEAERDGYKHGGRLTAAERHALPSKDFALPGGRYPINDANHGRNALARVAQNGSPEEQARVRAAVHRKFPNIGKG